MSARAIEQKQPLFVDARKGEVPAGCLCEYCENFFLGDDATKHVFRNPTHQVTWLSVEKDEERV
jgi:hypothetical protein